MIPRTPRGYQPKAVWLTPNEDGWNETAGFADVVFESDLPTHSSVLGPDGKPLRYEPKPPIGFMR